MWKRNKYIFIYIFITVISASVDAENTSAASVSDEKSLKDAYVNLRPIVTVTMIK